MHVRRLPRCPLAYGWYLYYLGTAHAVYGEHHAYSHLLCRSTVDSSADTSLDAEDLEYCKVLKFESTIGHLGMQGPKRRALLQVISSSCGPGTEDLEKRTARQIGPARCQKSKKFTVPKRRCG